jgi:hypothetical protein
MLTDQLNKNEKIKSLVRLLAKKYGEENFRIKDFWEADLCAIGLSDMEEKHLVYFSTYNEKGIYVSLENLKTSNDLPYETVGDSENLDEAEWEKIVVQHLRLKTH